MGYLSNSGLSGPPYSCHDLYKWCLQLDPKFKTDDELNVLIKDEEPDVELWQFMGRRYLPPPQPIRSPRAALPTPDFTQPSYSVTSKGMVRPVTIRVQYSFADQALRDRVAQRLTASGLRVTSTWRES